MSKNSAQNSIIDMTDEKMHELLMMGNVPQSNKKNHLINSIQQIELGNKKLYKQFINVLLDIIKKNIDQKQTKQRMFDHITSLAITANPGLINDLNNDVFTIIPTFYNEKDSLQDYISLWKHMYNGKKDKEDFPNVSKTLQKISTPQSIKLSDKLSKCLNEFNKNIEKSKQKKVQFFQDFDDSSLSESVVDSSRMTEIVYMDIMELKAIRQRVENQPLSEQNCTEHLIKMKTFLNLKSNSLPADILAEFNKQKTWAKHFIDHHQEYLKRNHNTSQQSLSVNKTNALLISLSKDEESIDQHPPNFQKNKNRLSIPKQQTFGYIDQGSSQNKVQSQIQNFTINEVPIDESRFTERSSNNKLPVFNNSLNEGVGEDYVNEKSQFQNSKGHANMLGYGNNFYQKMQLQPKEKRQNAIKPMPISRPIPEETLPLQQSTLNNISIPVQISTPMMKPHMNQLQQFPKSNNYGQNVEYPNSKNNFSSSHNPFANSKTNYNPQSPANTPYDHYRQNKMVIDAHSPIRNRMAEDDLDSDQLDQNLIIRPHYQKNIVNSNADNQYNQYSATQYAKTQLNFNPHRQNLTLNLHSQKKMHSHQLSPRSVVFSESKNNKKRLSELTSQKKQRKVNAPKPQSLNMPEQYAFRPYSVHFKRNCQNFNNFKRNCFQQKFPVYVSEQLVITCTLKKLKDSKLQVEILYDNQCREQLKMIVLYKIPKSFKIQKVSKIHRKFNLKATQNHRFNLKVSEFPLQMCFLQLSYSLMSEDQAVSNVYIPLPITIKSFIESLVSSRDEWMKTYKKLTTESSNEPYLIQKTFELNREIVQPSELKYVLSKEFLNIGASEGYSVEQFGCICHYREINNLMFLVRISVRVDHIATISIISEHQTTDNERDFMKYYLEILVTLLAKYII